MRTVVQRDVAWGAGNFRYIKHLSDLICKQTVRPRDNVSSPLTLRQQWVDFSSFIIFLLEGQGASCPVL